MSCLAVEFIVNCMLLSVTNFGAASKLVVFFPIVYKRLSRLAGCLSFVYSPVSGVAFPLPGPLGELDDRWIDLLRLS